MNDGYIYAADKLDEAHLAVSRALRAMRSLGYSPTAIEDAEQDLRRWRARLTDDWADMMQTG